MVAMVGVRSPVYFYKRNQTYYFSRAIPSDLRHRFNKPKIEVSLRTKSKLKAAQFETQILAASIRTVNHASESARIGADVMTAPPAVIKSMINHPLTEKGLADFLEDIKFTKQKIL